MQKEKNINNKLKIKLQSNLNYLKDHITNLHDKEERLLKDHKNKYREFLTITNEIKNKENKNKNKLLEELEKHGEFVKEIQISILEIEHEIIDTYIDSYRKLVQIYKLNEDCDG